MLLLYTSGITAAAATIGGGCEIDATTGAGALTWGAIINSASDTGATIGCCTSTGAMIGCGTNCWTIGVGTMIGCCCCWTIGSTDSTRSPSPVTTLPCLHKGTNN